MSKNMMPTLDIGLISKAKDLKRRIWFTILVLIVCRIGSYIPIPGVDANILSLVAAKNSSGILGMFNMLSGGSLGRMTIFALAIMPYITASIIIQLLTVVSKNLESLKKEGEAGRKKINQYTKYATVFLAAFQAFGIAVSLEKLNNQGHGMVVLQVGYIFKVTTIFTLVTGTMFLLWLSDQINNKGIGNGTSLIIFSGIVSGIPSALINIFELSRAGAITPYFILILLMVAVGMIALIVFMERAQRRILVQYPKRQVGNKIYGGEASHMPLKLNTAGVIPPIFASAILLFPLTIVNFAQNAESSWLDFVVRYLAHGKPLYILLYIGLIMFFSFFYTAVIFNPEQTADNLKKYGGFIPGRRPGHHTAEYLDYILTRITVIGALYIAFICVVPEILMVQYSVPFYLGGTSILIVVNVVMDSITQIQTHLFAHQYDSLIKKAKLREKRV